MLEYENQMFLDVLHQDGLLVTAKGLSLETIFLNLVKVYSDPGNLVIVIGTTGKEEEFFVNQLADENVKPLPKVITNEYNSSDREIVYLEGGVLFVSSRILVVDLLKNRLPIEKVTGFLVYRAHAILESCQEAFAVRLFRQKNKTGFIKAFSSAPQAFTRGFAQVQHIMKTLFVCNLYLWPRFHANVRSSLDSPTLSVTELHVQMTPQMKELQAALLDLISLSIKDLKMQNPSMDLDDVTVENVIARSFHKLLHQQLDPSWHQLNAQTHKLIADLRSLCSMLNYLTRYDSVTFHNLVSGFRTRDYALKCSGWCLLDAAETVFVVAEKRASGLSGSEGVLNPEVCPKWTVLTEVLVEINKQSKECGRKGEKTLILVPDKKTCEQIKQLLTLGAHNLLQHLSRNMKTTAAVSKHPASRPITLADDPDRPEEEVTTIDVKKEPEEAEEDMQDFYMLTQKCVEEQETSGDAGVSSSQYEEVKEEKVSQLETDSWQPPMLYIQPFKRNNDPTALIRSLEDLKPKYVILYDMDMTAVRRLEVFNAKHPEIGLQIFVLVYSGTVEEQAYLTTLRREKEAFEFLINEKASMVVATNQDGRSDDNPLLTRDTSKPSETVTNTRKGGLSDAQPKKESRIIVDMREFRSELPALIYKRGIEIEPITLHVGDYILTPEICVERKSVSDLIGSLNSGRLYTQAVAMMRHYAKPMLLIEFDHNKPFVLQGQYYVSKNVSSKDVSAKLQLLTLHFPKLRLVWSPSPYATAELFDELKQGYPEPDAMAAASIGAELESELDSDKFNTAVHDFVAKLPGVITKTLKNVLSKGKSLDHLVRCSKEQLQELVGNSLHANDLYSSLHNVLTEDSQAGPSSRGASSKGRGGKWQGFKKLKFK
ncbi:DNA repair endonuclease XPF [Gryllus bimaculatus]|nr:DNA repair endonuclease XPF [Gryllus bimaculatus]